MRRLLTPLVLGALALGLTACGSDEAKAPATTDAADEAASDSDSPSATSAAPSADDTATDETFTDETFTDDPIPDDTEADGQATEGDAFCRAAEAAENAGSSVDFESGSPETIGAQIDASIDAADAAAAIAPPDIAETIAQVADLQRQLKDVLEPFDYDFEVALKDAEVSAFLSNPEFQQVSDDLEDYLAANCAIDS